MMYDLHKSTAKWAFTTFPDGQPQLQYNDLDWIPKSMDLKASITSPLDLFKLAMLMDVMRRRIPTVEVHLWITYLMGARMDRVMSPNEPFTLKVVCDYLNSLKFTSITLFDPHSDVAPALLNANVIDNAFFVRTALEVDMGGKFTTWPDKLTTPVLISPDGGALKKIYPVAEYLAGKIEVVECSKHRDVKTGKLSGFKVNGDVAGRVCYIIDDICDGGGTFVGLAKKLREGGATQVILIVSHGIFSKGIDAVLVDTTDNQRVIDKIYTTNSYKDQPESNSVFQVIDHYMP